MLAVLVQVRKIVLSKRCWHLVCHSLKGGSVNTSPKDQCIFLLRIKIQNMQWERIELENSPKPSPRSSVFPYKDKKGPVHWFRWRRGWEIPATPTEQRTLNPVTDQLELGCLQVNSRSLLSSPGVPCYHMWGPGTRSRYITTSTLKICHMTLWDTCELSFPSFI